MVSIKSEIDQKRVIKMLYVNWKGEEAVRTVVPEKLWYGHTEWHKEDQWLLHAFDIEKGDYRDYAMKDIRKWGV